MVLPAIWTVPVVLLTAHQPLERDLIARHTARVAAGARWTDNTVALSTAEAEGRPRPPGPVIAVHPTGQPEVSMTVENERGKLDRFGAGDSLRILRDPEHPGLGMFPQPLLPLVHPGRPFATVGFLVVLGAMLVIWWCILIGVLGRRALLPTRWLRVDRYPLTADPPGTGPEDAAGPADARPDSGTDTDPGAPTAHLCLPPLTQVFGPDERLGMSALALYPMGAIWLNSTGVLLRFNGVGVFAVEVVLAAAYTAMGFGVAVLVERRRARQQSAPTGSPAG